MNCPKCNSPLAAEAKFCEHCGERIPETVAAAAAAPATIFCTNCGTKTSAGAAFCENCGARIEGDTPVVAPVTPVTPAAAPAKPAKAAFKLSDVPKKVWILGGCALAGLALIIVAILIITTIVNTNNRKNYAVYMKDHELIFWGIGSDKNFQITDNLTEDMDDDDMARNGSALAYYTRMTNKNQRLFFVDEVNGGYDAYATLYYMDLYEKDAEPVEVTKISIDQPYAVNADGTKVIYSFEGTLYQHNLAESTKIDEDVEWWRTDSEGKRVVFYNEDGDLYEKVSGKDKEKIDSDIRKVHYVSDDCKEIVYQKDENLYAKKAGKDKEKLVSDIYSVITVYGADSFYYLMREEKTIHIADYVIDELKESDAAMTRPIYPDYPDYPYSWEYASDAEYQAAVEKYNQDMVEFEKLKEEYNTKLQEYYNRNDRENIREYMDSYDFSLTNYALYYYDGEVGNQVVSSVDSDYNYSYAMDDAVIAFKAFAAGEATETDISDIKSLYSLTSELRNAMEGQSDWAIAVGTNVTNLANGNIYDPEIRVGEAGKSAYFLANVEDGKGTLYRISIENGKASEPVESDTNVSTCRHVYIGGDQFIYFKEYDSEDSAGDLYIDGEKVDTDVYIYGVYYNEKGKSYLYFTDWNDEKDYGTFKQYKGDKTTKIADDVHAFGYTSKGELLYLYDYSMSSYSGDLYQFSEGKAKKIDTDVNAILSMSNLTE